MMTDDVWWRMISIFYVLICHPYRISQVALVVKNPPANAGQVINEGSIPGPEEPLEEGLANLSSILA